VSPRRAALLALQAEHVLAASSLESEFDAIGAVTASTAQARTASAGPPAGAVRLLEGRTERRAPAQSLYAAWLMSRWVSWLENGCSPRARCGRWVF
jgi:hypothetical protein